MISTDVPRTRRLLQCICAIIWCLVSGGPIFGFAALKPILVTEGVYEYTCDVGVEPLFHSLEGSAVSKCNAQDLKLNMMFTVGAALTNVSALVIGRVLDIYGPRVCGLIGAAFLYLALAIFIYAKNIESLTPIDPWVTGYACLALGGPFAYISSFQLSNSFPKKSGVILALITGAFDASSAVFLIYRLFYTKSEGSFTIARFFKVYLLVPAFITVAQFLVMEKESYKTAPSDSTDVSTTEAVEPVPNSEHQLLLPQQGRRDSIGDAIKQHYVEEGEEALVAHSGIFGILHGQSAHQQLRSWWFIIICIFSSVQMLRLNYFVATIGSQYTYLFGSVERAEKLNRLFDIALPVGGLISIPFVGLFLDNFSSMVVVASVVGLSLFYGLAGLLGHWIAGVANVLVFVGFRPLFYTVISDVCAKVFGFETFGTLYGTIMSISGVVNFGQSLLDDWTHSTFDMNPRPINVILVAVTAVVGTTTVLYVRQQGIAFFRKKQGQRASALE